MNTGDRAMTKYYLDRSFALLDSLHVDNWHQHWFNLYRYYYGFITADSLIHLMKTNFNHRFSWPKAKTYYDIASICINESRTDSARRYFELAKASWDPRFSRYFLDIDGLEVQVMLQS